jgi:hypothetical protein
MAVGNIPCRQRHSSRAKWDATTKVKLTSNRRWIHSISPKTCGRPHYNAEYAHVAPDTCNCFWMQGGAAELSATLWKGWGVSAQTGFNLLSG